MNRDAWKVCWRCGHNFIPFARTEAYCQSCMTVMVQERSKKVPA